MLEKIIGIPMESAYQYTTASLPDFNANVKIMRGNWGVWFQAVYVGEKLELYSHKHNNPDDAVADVNLTLISLAEDEQYDGILPNKRKRKEK
jgi:hypothetical protein